MACRSPLSIHSDSNALLWHWTAPGTERWVPRLVRGGPTNQSLQQLGLPVNPPSLINAFPVFLMPNEGLLNTVLDNEDRRMTDACPTLKSTHSHAHLLHKQQRRCKLRAEGDGGQGRCWPLGLPGPPQSPSLQSTTVKATSLIWFTEHSKCGWSELRIKYSPTFKEFEKSTKESS